MFQIATEIAWSKAEWKLLSCVWAQTSQSALKIHKALQNENSDFWFIHSGVTRFLPRPFSCNWNYWVEYNEWGYLSKTEGRQQTAEVSRLVESTVVSLTHSPYPLTLPTSPEQEVATSAESWVLCHLKKQAGSWKKVLMGFLHSIPCHCTLIYNYLK